MLDQQVLEEIYNCGKGWSPSGTDRTGTGDV